MGISRSVLRGNKKQTKEQQILEIAKRFQHSYEYVLTGVEEGWRNSAT
jgi:hypothetical protein